MLDEKLKNKNHKLGIEIKIKYKIDFSSYAEDQ